MRAARALTAAAIALLSGCATPPPSAPAAHTVDFEIDLRPALADGRFVPGRDHVGVRGSLAPLSWSHSVPAEVSADGLARVRVVFERLPFGGQALQYKFRIEHPGQGADEGWEPGRNHRLRPQGASTRLARAFGAAPQELLPRRTGRIEELGLQASTHVAPRAVQVWLPPGYGDDPARRHPVLYLHDGQNVFDDRAAGAEWMLDETAQALVRAGAIDAPILVAIDSGPDRLLDYTPTRAMMGAARTGTGQAATVGGGAPAYARFLLDELKPRIDARYRTRPDAANTAVGGSSLGGLVSLWLALEHPDRIGAALVVSPSLWWDDRLPLRLARAWPLQAPVRPRLWLDMGAHEGAEALPALRQLQEALMARGWSAPTLRVVEDAQGGHDEASWAARGEGMLRFLYAPPASVP